MTCHCAPPVPHKVPFTVEVGHTKCLFVIVVSIERAFHCGCVPHKVPFTVDRRWRTGVLCSLSAQCGLFIVTGPLGRALGSHDPVLNRD